MSPAEVTEKLGLHRMRDRSWYVHPRCVLPIFQAQFSSMTYVSNHHLVAQLPGKVYLKGFSGSHKTSRNASSNPVPPRPICDAIFFMYIQIPPSPNTLSCFPLFRFTILMAPHEPSQRMNGHFYTCPHAFPLSSPVLYTCLFHTYTQSLLHIHLGAWVLFSL